MCGGHSMIRCSRGNGPIGWSITSPMCACTSPTVLGISRRWSAPISSPSLSSSALDPAKAPADSVGRGDGLLGGLLELRRSHPVGRSRNTERRNYLRVGVVYRRSYGIQADLQFLSDTGPSALACS